ncbi:MAG: SA1362 family protein [Ectobacillus sp.]
MNGRSFTFVLFFIVIGLASFQLVSFAVQNPAGLVKNLLTFAIVIGAIYLLYKLFTSSSSSANPRSSYNRAVKQSKKKYGKSNGKANTNAKPNITHLSSSFTKKTPTDTQIKKGNTSLKRKRKQTHLTVIEGKKGKKKHRASF